MSILVHGIEMPKYCCVCPCFNDEYCYCQATGKELGSTLIDRRHSDCPLIEAQPHGRLIDADELMLRIQEYIDEYGWDVDEHGFHSEKWCAMKETEMAINDAPTVIPADKDGET